MWEEHARDAIAWFRTPGHDSYWRYHRDQFLEILPPPGKRTFDVGCGEGRLSRDLKALGHKVAGCDTSQTMIEAARKADPVDRLSARAGVRASRSGRRGRPDRGLHVPARHDGRCGGDPRGTSRVSRLAGTSASRSSIRSIRRASSNATMPKAPSSFAAPISAATAIATSSSAKGFRWSSRASTGRSAGTSTRWRQPASSSSSYARRTSRIRNSSSRARLAGSASPSSCTCGRVRP